MIQSFHIILCFVSQLIKNGYGLEVLKMLFTWSGDGEHSLPGR